jgi:UDP-N-acetylmuramoyl-tripeptide--D-alanyl-D-alanine ligase
MRLPLGELARWLDARVVTGAESVAIDDVLAHDVSYDSRSLRTGELFVAVVAERDGHDFVEDAVRAGAAGVLVSREIAACPVPQIVVSDTAAALTALGVWARVALAPRVRGRVVGITGSVGKTTTKDFVAAALSARYSVGASEKSLNNDQGVPVTLLNAPDDVEALVVEMGMRGFGEIARLADLVKPDIAVITRVAESHSERVGGIEGVARAKSELVSSIDEFGFAVLNGDDHRVAAMSSLTQGKSYLFGTADTADMWFGDVVVDANAGTTFSYRSRWGNGTCRLSVPGAHMASNAAAALLVAALCGVPLADAAASLAETRLSPMRMAIHRIVNGTLLDDSYNASPTSVIAALDTAASLPGRRRIAVLGVMAEVADAPSEHLRVAQRAHELGIELVAYGTDLYGVEPLASYDDIVARLAGLPPETVMLVKGSRVAGLDRVVRLLL